MAQNENEAKKARGGRTITDLETTLGDLNRRDRDNFEHLMKTAYVFQFKTAPIARKFMGLCVDKVLRKCGVKIKRHMIGKDNKVQKLMDRQDVRVEFREYDLKEPLYQTGLYIYQHNEIVGFVSSPFYHHGQGLLQTIEPFICIRTTEPMKEYRNMDKKQAPAGKDN